MIRIFLSTLARAAGAALLAFTAAAHAVTLNNSFGAQPFLDTALGGTTAARRPLLALLHPAHGRNELRAHRVLRPARRSEPDAVERVQHVCPGTCGARAFVSAADERRPGGNRRRGAPPHARLARANHSALRPPALQRGRPELALAGNASRAFDTI